MFLFILESIGTPELLLIAVVALIFLGPRKLPQIAKTIGKTMAEFRNATNEFKETWQREVDLEEEAEALRTGDLAEPVPREKTIMAPESRPLGSPEIRTIDKEEFDRLAPAEAESKPPEPADLSDKRNWL